jgi:cell division protein FtsB
LIQTPSRRGVSQNLPLHRSRVGHVERLGSRESHTSYSALSSRDVLVSRLGATGSITAKPVTATAASSRTQTKLLRKQARREQSDSLEAPATVLPAPLPVKRMSRILLVLGLVGSLHVLIMLGIEVNRTLEMRQGITRLSTDVKALESEVAELKAVIEHRNDQNYLEQLARQQGFAFPNETRFITLLSEGQP